MLDHHVAQKELDGVEINDLILGRCRTAVDRLLGRAPARTDRPTRASFLEEEFTIPNIHRLPIQTAVVPIVEDRLKEARLALKAGANLSVVLLCGSILEAVLLGAAQESPERFNASPASPKYGAGRVKKFPDWSLAQFIDVACEIGLLKPDVKAFGHGLRGFRNYIYPYQQLVSGFSPDQHTAKLLCVRDMSAREYKLNLE